MKKPRVQRAQLSHVGATNQPGMVDVGAKAVTLRTAHAQARVTVPPEVVALLRDNEIRSKKGPVFQTAIIAGTLAAKKTADLIPFRHPLALEDCTIEAAFDGAEIVIDCKVSVRHKTGVEMEALTGASVAALTIYDMLKSVSHDLVIRQTRLVEKTGGKSDYRERHA